MLVFKFKKMYILYIFNGKLRESTEVLNCCERKQLTQLLLRWSSPVTCYCRKTQKRFSFPGGRSVWKLPQAYFAIRCSSDFMHESFTFASHSEPFLMSVTVIWSSRNSQLSFFPSRGTDLEEWSTSERIATGLSAIKRSQHGFLLGFACTCWWKRLLRDMLPV